MQIIETYLRSKKGEHNGGEDRLILGYESGFYGVADGATDKSKINWGTPTHPKTGGAVAADAIKGVLEFTKQTDPTLLVNKMNAYIHGAALKAKVNLQIIKNKPAAAFCAYSEKDRMMYRISDCNYAFLHNNGEFKIYKNENYINELTSSLRSAIIKVYVEKGINPFKDGRDMGREFILQMLERQVELQNRKYVCEEEWMMGIRSYLVAYKVIDGTETTIDTIPVPKDVREIVITSDGFSAIKPTLDETLEIHERLLKEDPHCIGVLKSTKGLQPGNISFDDMSYMRIKL